MTLRQAGRRGTAAAARRRSGSRRTVSRRDDVGRGNRRKEEPLRAGERRQLIQLMVCGGIFVLLVAAKFLLPGWMTQINGTLAQALERNMDVRAVFSAVGRALTGEDGLSGAAGELYQAVFQPSDEAQETAAVISIPADDAAVNTLREALLSASEPLGTDAEEDAAGGAQPEQQAVSSLTYIMYSNQNLPENASMEQALLNFDYCVPVSGTLSSDFGYREHPVEGEERFHYGVDLAADTGTDIVCFADGTVTAVGESSSYGKYCMVSHSGGFSTLYAHCSRITVTSGASVRKGQKIAEVGETGIATGPHLHFELQKDGTYLNPIYYVV